MSHGRNVGPEADAARPEARATCGAEADAGQAVGGCAGRGCGRGRCVGRLVAGRARVVVGVGLVVGVAIGDRGAVDAARLGIAVFAVLVLVGAQLADHVEGAGEVATQLSVVAGQVQQARVAFEQRLAQDLGLAVVVFRRVVVAEGFVVAVRGGLLSPAPTATGAQSGSQGLGRDLARVSLTGVQPVVALH